MLKTLLASLLDSFIKTSSTKALMSNSAAPNYRESVVMTGNKPTAPFDGICVMRISILATGNFAAFMYVDDSTLTVAVSGFRASGVASNYVSTFIPVKKGDVINADFDNASLDSITFVKTVGSAS